MAITYQINNQAFRQIERTLKELRADAGLPGRPFLKQLNFGLITVLKGAAKKAAREIRTHAKLPRRERTGESAKAYSVRGLRAVRSSRTGKYYRRFGAEIRILAERAPGGGPVKGGLRLGGVLGLHFGNKKFRTPIMPIQRSISNVTERQVESMIVTGIKRRIAQRLKKFGEPQTVDSIFRRRSSQRGT